MVCEQCGTVHDLVCSGSTRIPLAHVTVTERGSQHGEHIPQASVAADPQTVSC